MAPLKARVCDGKLVFEDASTDLPEGAVVRLRIVEAPDAMGDEERARLHEALRRSLEQAKAGQLIHADQVISRLLARE
ncbi:MAG: hypothetical protein GXP55_17700 [Deltaproteobacteria bacterium]|nr:hypothetical protein [Deltaproteobacteria bacterium]